MAWDRIWLGVTSRYPQLLCHSGVVTLYGLECHHDDWNEGHWNPSADCELRNDDHHHDDERCDSADN